MSTTRPTAGDRLTRLLAIIPWVADHGGLTVGEIAQRFSYDPAQLLADLTDIVHYVGVPPYTPDTMIEVTIEDERVWINYADYFSRPLRLTPEESLALLTAGRALLDISDTDSDTDTDTDDAQESSPLLRALTKLGAAIGASSGSLDIRLGTTDDQVMSTLRAAVASSHQVRIDYYSYSTDRRAERVIEPDRVFSDEGQWYVSGYCHLAHERRVFRIDRIVDAVVLDTTFEPRRGDAGLPVTDPEVALPHVTIDVSPEARWVADYYPNTGTSTRDDGWTRITLPVTAPAWIERLLVRLGPDARVVEAPDDLGDARRWAAIARILARYGHRP